MIPDITVPPCAHCGHEKKWEGLIVSGKNDKPQSGGLYVCGECFKINLLEVEGKGRQQVQRFRKLEPHEVRALRQDPVLLRKVNKAILDAQAIRFVKRGGLRP